MLIVSITCNISWAQSPQSTSEPTSIHATPSSKNGSKYHPLKMIDQASTALAQLAEGNPQLPSPTWQDVYLHWKNLFKNGQHSQLIKEINLIFGSFTQEEWIAILNYLESNLDTNLDPVLAAILIALPTLYPHDLWWIPIIAKLAYHNREMISETSLWLFESGYVNGKRISKKTLSWIERHFDTHSETVRIKTIRLWSFVADRSEKAWNTVIQSLQDHSPHVRKAAINALVQLKKDIVRWLPKILPLLKEGKKEAIDSFQLLRQRMNTTQFNIDPYLKKIKWLLPQWLKAEFWPETYTQEPQEKPNQNSQLKPIDSSK